MIDKIKYHKDRLSVAKERVKEFSTIASIFNNFESYDIMIDNRQDLPSNVVFNLICNPNYEDGTYNEIKRLENALNRFSTFNTIDKEVLEYQKRLTSDDNFTSIQAYKEVTFAYEIGKKIDTMKNKLQLISKGFLVYKIRQVTVIALPITL